MKKKSGMLCLDKTMAGMLDRKKSRYGGMALKLIYKQEKGPVVREIKHIHMHKQAVTQNRFILPRYFYTSRFTVLLRENMELFEGGQRERAGQSLKRLIRHNKLENTLYLYAGELFRKRLLQEQYYYRTRPSMTSRLIWEMMGSKNTFLLLTRFYFGSMQRRDFAPKDRTKESSLMVYLLKDIQADAAAAAERRAAGEKTETGEKEPDKTVRGQPWPVVNTWHLSEAEMKTVVNNVYKEIEKKIKKERIQRGRW